MSATWAAGVGSGVGACRDLVLGTVSAADQVPAGRTRPLPSGSAGRSLAVLGWAEGQRRLGVSCWVSVLPRRRLRFPGRPHGGTLSLWNFRQNPLGAGSCGQVRVWEENHSFIHSFIQHLLSVRTICH